MEPWGLSTRLLAVAFVLLASTGCKKRAGEDCESGAMECARGLACLGTPGRCQDCKETEACKTRGACFAVEDRCDHDPDDRREGCPCGCDHSEAMTADLEVAEPAVALPAIDRSLRTIAEREDLGYVTEAMVSHRLRLLSLRERLSVSAPRADRDRVASGERDAARALRRAQPAGGDATLRVRQELVVHGRTTERVHGRDKLLPACFRWWLELENVADTAVVLKAPTIESGVPFPVSRWYEEDGDGQPWDGRLGPRQKKAVLVIGYLGEQVEPGTRVHATARVGSVAFEASTRARARWDRAFR